MDTGFLFEKAAMQKNISLTDSSVLIIGATGDIGMACTYYLKNKMGKLLLCARNEHRLDKIARELMKENIPLAYSTSLHELIPEADVVTRLLKLVTHIGPKRDPLPLHFAFDVSVR